MPEVDKCDDLCTRELSSLWNGFDFFSLFIILPHFRSALVGVASLYTIVAMNEFVSVRSVYVLCCCRVFGLQWIVYYKGNMTIQLVLCDWVGIFFLLSLLMGLCSMLCVNEIIFYWPQLFEMHNTVNGPARWASLLNPNVLIMLVHFLWLLFVIVIDCR